jgi:putative ABC transport system permease protein
MLTNYFKIALKVFLRRKFFTFISLFGISFTLVVLMAATAILDHTFASLAPEVNQDRTLVIFRASMFGEHSMWSNSAGYRLLNQYARNLPGAERMSILSRPQTVYSYRNGNKVRIDLKRTDGDFWHILRFDFIEGAPYTAQDVAEARFVAVITETTRERLVGRGPALGRTIEVDGQRFRVVGVVRDVPWLRQVPYAEMWAPITTAKSDSYKSELLGSFCGLVLARDQSAIPAIKEEFRNRLARVELPDPKRYKKLVAPLETTLDQAARSLFRNQRDEDSHTGQLWAVIIGSALLFMLLPTVNLINLNVSRIMERASEIGVRKAFGASSHTLVGQFVVENVILTLVGGVVGLVMSFVVLRAITASDFVPYANLTLNYRIFLYGLGLALFFGVFSGVYPAWRMSRLNPVQALKGASR